MRPVTDPVAPRKAPTPRARSIRQRTLSSLRWLAIGGQSAAVLTSEFALGLQLPLLACAICIGCSISVNIAAKLWPAHQRRLSERAALLTLSFDLAQLSVLLYLTGGLNNPFSLFLLAPVTIAATVLTLRTTVALGAFSVIAASALSVCFEPLEFHGDDIREAPRLLLIGAWVAIALGVTFQAAFARRVSMEAFQMSAALTASQMALEREQRLSALGALAAAAAHELGTPLATIKVVARELRRELRDTPELADDAELINEQATRCRGILDRLSIVGAPDEDQQRLAPIVDVVEQAIGPHRYRRAAVFISLDGQQIENDAPTPPAPLIWRRPEIIYGLRNLIQNAVDFADSTVWIDILTDGPEIRITVRDDGPGFPPDVLDNLGEPFASRRGGEWFGDGNDAYEGMGLGVFIAKTLLERTGAELRFANSRLAAPTGDDAKKTRGANAKVTWRRDSLSATKPA